MKEKDGFVSKYKKFALKGNIMDLAIAVVIGGAFSRIVQSLVNHIIMPLLSLLIGDINFVDLKVVFKPSTSTTAEVSLLYGSFIQIIIEFLIISISIFVIFSMLSKLGNNKLDDKEDSKPSNEEIQIKLLEDIRDLLRK